MRWRQRFALGLVCALALAGIGCVKRTLLKGQIDGMRATALSVDQLDDFDVAKKAAFEAMTQFEDMHRLAPKDEDPLYWLTKSSSLVAFAFEEDEWEILADAKQTQLAEDHRRRTVATYERAVAYGIELLDASGHPGFLAARKTDATLRKWLKSEFSSALDAQNLLWLGHAWMLKANADKDDDDTAADVWVGLAVLERSVELDSKSQYGAGLTALGAYHARSRHAELSRAAELFARAMAVTGGRSLTTRLFHATTYQCSKGDKAAYVKTLTEIVGAGDSMPEIRLSNVVAKRKAARCLTPSRMQAAAKTCGFAD